MSDYYDDQARLEQEARYVVAAPPPPSGPGNYNRGSLNPCDYQQAKSLSFGGLCTSCPLIFIVTPYLLVASVVPLKGKLQKYFIHSSLGLFSALLVIQKTTKTFYLSCFFGFVC